MEEKESEAQNNRIKEDCVRKKTIGGNHDRVKRDEWSEGAVSTLLEAYEAKWILRNRAKLKGIDWEDVARCVSSRENSGKSPKTSTQCKNKIESMKKRYRSESAAADVSSWPLYPRLHLLLRGPGTVTSAQVVTPSTPVVTPLVMLEPSRPPSRPSPPPTLANAQNSDGSNAVDKLAKEEELLATKSSEKLSNKNNLLDTDSSTPVLYSDKDNLRCNNKRKVKIDQNIVRRRKKYMEIAESLRWLAEAVVRSEEARMDTMKEIEKMRVEAEAKRGELDLKKTEIIAKTQLEIARIFASVNKGVDASLRIGRS